MNSIKLQAYGKINLSLDVLRKRKDGYHDVRMIMQTVKLHDNIDMHKTLRPGIELKTNLFFLPTDENNLMYKAARMLMEEFQIEDGIRMELKKVIPVAAGMAGGSADAAAVLLGINRLFGLGLSLEELQKRGVKLGADVPFCLMRGTALSEGIGEILTPLNHMPPCTIVLAKPQVGVSTKFVYDNLGVNRLPKEAHPDVDAVLQALAEKSLRGVTSHVGNILETVTCKHYPAIEEIKSAMMDMGAMCAMMSGSGPTVFGIFDKRTTAEKCYKALRYGSHKRLAKQVYLTEPWR